MKKIIILLSIAVIISASVYAEDADNNSVSEMSALRKKLGRMKHEMDLLMKDIISTGPAAGEAVMNTFGSDVYVDILQSDKNVIVKADLPGMDKDKIEIVLDNNRYLKISGTREVTKSEKSPGVVRQERFFGNFSKTVELPCEVTPIGINATYKDGVLEVTIPKKVKSPKEEAVKIPVR